MVQRCVWLALVGSVFVLFAANADAEEPNPDVTLEVVGTNTKAGERSVTVRFKNAGKESAIVYPFFGVRVLDDNDKEMPMSTFIGYGVVGEGFLAERERTFVTVPAGKSEEVTVKLNGYHGEDALMAWRLRKGTYKVVLTHDFNREKFKEKYLRKPYISGEAKDEDKPERLWNQATESKQTVEAKLVVE